MSHSLFFSFYLLSATCGLSFLLGSGFCESPFFSSFLAGAEFFNAAGNIKQFFGAGVERMAVAADLNRHRFSSRANSEGVAAGALNFCRWIVFWMDILFHPAIVQGLDKLFKREYKEA